MIKPPHPGEIINEDYIVPLGISVNRLAKGLGIGAPRLNEIVRGKRGITADTALRLARYFGLMHTVLQQPGRSQTPLLQCSKISPYSCRVSHSRTIA